MRGVSEPVRLESSPHIGIGSVSGSNGTLDATLSQAITNHYPDEAALSPSHPVADASKNSPAEDRQYIDVKSSRLLKK